MSKSSGIFKLTRFLYNEEEVKLSLITSILNKKDIFECYYWFSELYYSKLDVCDIIWEIYFDYFALINPKLEHYIIKKMNDWNEKSEIDHLLYIIKNLHIAKYDCRVFLMRQIAQSDTLCQTSIYRKYKFKNIEKYDKKYYPLFMSLNRKRWINLCYYLNKLFKNGNDSYEIYHNILDYLLNTQHTVRNAFEDLWKMRIDKRDLHFTLKTISRLLMKTDCICVKNVYVSPLKDDIDEIKTLEVPVIPIYKTLPNRRWFKIDENIGSFDLLRFNFEDYCKENFNWEYYASFTPLWKERIDEFSATINQVTKIIEFDDDETLEGFYEKYGYELDEQSKTVQDCSLVQIEKKTWIDWFKYIGYGYINQNCDENTDKFNIGFDICLDELPDDFRLK